MGTVFAWTVTILAALAVLGALAYVVVWEVAAIRRLLDRHRPENRPPDDGDFWRQQRALTSPTGDTSRPQGRAGDARRPAPPLGPELAALAEQEAAKRSPIDQPTAE